jgi:hypothetical protein
MAALLLMGVVAILPLTNSASAQASATITTSADQHGNRFFGPAWAEVMIDVPSHRNDSANVGTLQVQITAFSSTQSYSITETTAASGIFLIYLRVDADKTTAEEPVTINAPFANTHHRIIIGDGALAAGYTATGTPAGSTRAPLDVAAANVVEGGSITVTASGVTKTLTYDDSSAGIVLDRTAFGPGSTIITQVRDQDANLDPTRVNTLTETAANQMIAAGGDAPTVIGTFTETGTNTAIFELTSLTVSAGALAVGQDSVSRSLTANDRNTFTAGAGGTPVNPGGAVIGTSASSYTVQTQRGTFQALNATSFASELPLRIADLDRNTNSRSEQPQANAVRVTVGNGAPTLFNLRENGLNSNTLLPNYSGDDLDLTFGATVNDPVTGVVAVTQATDVTVEYLDVFFLRAAFPEATNTIRADLNGDGDFTDTLVVGDTVNEANIRLSLNGDADAADTVNGIIESSVRVDLNGDGDFSDSLTGFTHNENTATMRLDVNGNGATTDAVAINTAVNERLIKIDADNDTSVNDVVAGITEANTIVDLDGIDLGGVSTKITFQLNNTAATLTADKTSASKSAVIGLTLTDADLNDDSTIVESFTTNFGASTAYTAVTGFTNQVYDFRIRISGTERNLASGAFSVTFTETGANTGVFKANINLQQLTNAIGGGFAFIDGDSVQFTVRERLDTTVNVQPETSASVTIGLTKPTVTIDRSTVGVPRNTPVVADVAVDGLPGTGVTPAFANLGNQIFSVTIVDAGANTNSLAEDTLISSTGATATSATGVLTLNNKLRLSLLDANGAAFGAAGLITVSKAIKETGFDTGVFTGEIQVASSPNDTPAQWIGSKLKFEYSGQDNTFGTTDDADTVSVGFTARNALLQTDTTVVANGKSITITVRDEDANRDAATAEQVTVGLRWVDDAGVTQNRAQTLDETGVNTGIFTKKIDVGTSSVGGIVMRVSPDEELRIRYYDLTPNIPGSTSWPAASSTQTQIDLTLTTVAATGGLTLTPTQVGPATEIKVSITDTDLNSNPASKQTITGRVTAVSDRGAASRADLNIDETGPNTGIFEGKVSLNAAQAAGSASSPSNDVTINALPGDIVSIRYEDEKGANGGRTTVTKTVQVVSVDPRMNFSKPTGYNVGESIVLTLNDVDANRDSDTADILTLRATSTTDAVGLTNVQAIETGANTGVFVATIQTSSNFSTGALQVRNGDNVTIEYEDAFPAAFRQKFDANGTLAGSTQKFRVNTVVGTAATTDSTTPSAPALANVDGSTVTEVTTGQQVVITSNVTNNDDQPRPATVIVEVRDADGITVYLQWQTATIAANGEIQVGLSWIPEDEGDYTIRTFVVSNLTTPQVLSEVVESEVTVS